ncbi:MAG: FHA domain-containing protein [Fuerstiella sp.]|nr:FHA domain-containing protein [Fuerstiella sp.]
MLWIDGVGAWQLYVGHSFSIGAPTCEGKSADITLQANISRQHATLHCVEENWQVIARHGTSVSGRTVNSATILRSGDQLRLGDRVKLGFRLPSVLSSTAVLDFESNHRPVHSVDGIVLMVDHCLLGPGREQHIFCPDWPDVVVFYVLDGSLRCRSSLSLKVDGRPPSDSVRLEHGSVVDGKDLRFRIEQIH